LPIFDEMGLWKNEKWEKNEKRVKV
jgi:hypothetical protein